MVMYTARKEVPPVLGSAVLRVDAPMRPQT